MDVLVVLIVFVLLAAVVVVLGAPLRAAWRGAGDDPGGPAQAPSEAAREADVQAERDTLEAAREAKYREIRDAELDYRTGKLSPEDYASTDAALRSEALAILDRLQACGEGIRPTDASAARWRSRRTARRRRSSSG